MAGRNVIVSGAASGIGFACADALLKQGDNVCAVDITPVAREKLAISGENFIEVKTDVGDATQCAAAVDACVRKFGKVDALIHMAAIHSTELWRDIDAARLDRVLHVNVTGTFLMAQACAFAMEKTGGGAMVFATSGSINLSGVGGHGRGDTAYVASKAGIIGLTRALSRCFAPLKIRVNAVSPGSTHTAMTADYSAEAVKGAGQRSLAGRMGEAPEIAAAALFLISKEASFVYGDIIAVNGGSTFGI